MKQNLISAIRLTVICLVFFSGIYTSIVWSIAQLTPNQGKGEMVSLNGKTFYANIAQNFSEERYFSSRPSAAAYDAAASGGSNKGPSNPDYLTDVQARVDTFLLHNPGINKSEIPSDLVTSSGAGLDPHISVQAAIIQAKRIARIRTMKETEVLAIINQNIEKPWLGLFGPKKINVLKLNCALDANNQ